MDKCVKSGLWVPKADKEPKTGGEGAAEKEENKDGEEEEVYEAVK